MHKPKNLLMRFFTRYFAPLIPSLRMTGAAPSVSHRAVILTQHLSVSENARKDLFITGKACYLTFLLILLISTSLHAQDTTTQQKPWGIQFSGFVNAQYFYDTRQMADAREGMVTLFPLPPLYDAKGEDINAQDTYNQLAMTSRLRGDISGPDVWGAKTSAAIEGDFTGQSNLDNNGFRLREAWAKMQWSKTSLLVGSYWHPLYVPEARPFTIGLNTGAPFHAFSRHNQIRIEQQSGNFNLVFFAGLQRDYSSAGPAGRSSIYQRNAAFPNLHLQLHYKFAKHLLAAGAGYKRIQPMESFSWMNNHYKTEATLGSLAATFFGKFALPAVDIKFQGIWGQNLTEHIMLGGYAVESINIAARQISYTNAEQLSFWTDIISTGKTLKAGLFAGYAQNLGLQSPATELYYGTGHNIAYLYRISPRLQYHIKNIMLAAEFEYTVAAYGTSDAYGDVHDAEETGNLRVLVGVFYWF